MESEGSEAEEKQLTPKAEEELRVSKLAHLLRYQLLERPYLVLQPAHSELLLCLRRKPLCFRAL